MVICSLDALKKSWEKKEARIKKEIAKTLSTIKTVRARAVEEMFMMKWTKN